MKISPEEFNEVRDFLLNLAGLILGDNKVYLLTRLDRLVKEQSCESYSDLCRKAKLAGNVKLIEAIIDEMTTNETLWFRDQHPFRILEELLLPGYLKEISSGKREKVRIWSAACSTGQEPYSIAMLIQDCIQKHSRLKPEMFEIVATDISQKCLQAARDGHYDQVAIGRGLSDEYRNRYFVNQGKYWALTNTVKELVSFERLNLKARFDQLGTFDIVFCRNVAIYFAREFKIDLFRKIAGRLKQGGVFFLGASESLSGYSNQFEIQEYKQGYIYRLRKG